MIKPITAKEIKYISYRLILRTLFDEDEGTDVSTRYPNILETCLTAPFETFSAQSAYPDIISKASILFYTMIKDHPFQKGNKRITISAIFMFFYKNKKWLKVSSKELYNFIIWISSSPDKLKTETLRAIEKFFKLHIIDYEPK
jgi:death-on-curing protein